MGVLLFLKIISSKSLAFRGNLAVLSMSYKSSLKSPLYKEQAVHQTGKI
jgi:hypothetical protein